MPDINDNQTIDAILMPVTDTQYGEDYRSHFLTMYRDYVASADAVSSRRNTANSFFLTINTGFLGAAGYFDAVSWQLALLQAFVGILFCLVWQKLILSYRSLNSSKFDVIQLIERNLPLAPFTAEEMVQKSGQVIHKALTTTEKHVPLIFGILHILVAISQIGKLL